MRYINKFLLFSFRQTTSASACIHSWGRGLCLWQGRMWTLSCNLSSRCTLRVGRCNSGERKWLLLKLLTVRSVDYLEQPVMIPGKRRSRWVFQISVFVGLWANCHLVPLYGIEGRHFSLTTEHREEKGGTPLVLKKGKTIFMSWSFCWTLFPTNGLTKLLTCIHLKSSSECAAVQNSSTD